MECVYLIRDNDTNLLKIGMTTNWTRRATQLQVGRTTTKIMTVPCKDSGKWERVLHAMFKHKRLPQSEWFKISEEDAISKMNWLASKTNQKIIVGKWKRAAAGNYYRRRQSTSGKWYTEQKSAYEIKCMHDDAVESAVESAERLQLIEARKEPGFWPTKENPNVVEWQMKDPTYRNWDRLINGFLIVFMGFPAALGVAMAIFMMGYILWPFLVILCIAFIVLKITGKLD
ncbi:bacteriophage-like DNA-binding domain-containing protein [Synechococcus sp. A15-127]|uniref:GIY-YIG nuclease family protein n=1 Tax=Synechococcus sp. A15-127 TaxID=1050624 RepID=UPI0016473652|nr:GIY-YIG nuclease family protein [Synechococcus sp. A15-127]QNI94543.1 bacteriophage-like DNA-binding domain-containing protein [Synechococcus sp. A15-127]